MYRHIHSFKLGFCPTRRTMTGPKAFNVPSALEQKVQIANRLKEMKIDFVDLEGLNEEGLLFHPSDVDAAAKMMIDAQVDAIFVPHCNFGCEEAVGKLAKKVGRPVLLWGPRDDEPDEEGFRYRDSQCGLFATSKLLSHLGVPFTYITNCRMEDPVFTRNLDAFIRAANVVSVMRNPRIGQISVRPDVFWSVKCNESELLERFGAEIVTMNLMDFKDLFEDTKANCKAELEEMAAATRASADKVLFGDDSLFASAALKKTILRWAEEEKLSAAASQCWMPMYKVTGLAPCTAFSELSEMGFPTICEVDIHGAMTSMMVQAAAMYQSPTFLADMTIRHPHNDNAELMWHCGVFPKSLKKPGTEVELAEHYNRRAPAVNHVELKGGDVTIARFDGVQGNYSLLMGHGHGVDGPKTFGSYAWIEFGNWPKWEHKFVYGPYIHHCTGVHGKFAPALYEACKYLPIDADPVEPTAQEIEEFLRG
ncbi:fucose isomerase [uncultured Oscillibacter sp.]|uniref:L-fucose/L-arabinose isomerase family protein n=1 Tax=uncultured Oscillibacter sp. TaxID=876091 RepID=UPI0028049E45|nr:fucose isomerase [uncultured Oscillibacter sp.]